MLMLKTGELSSEGSQAASHHFIILVITLFVLIFLASCIEKGLAEAAQGMSVGIYLVLLMACLLYPGCQTDDPANTIKHREYIMRHTYLVYYEYDTLEELQNAADSLNRAGKLLTAKDSDYVFLGQVDGKASLLQTDNGPLTVGEMIESSLSIVSISEHYYYEEVVPFLREQMTPKQRAFDLAVRALRIILILGIFVIGLISNIRNNSNKKEDTVCQDQ